MSELEHDYIIIGSGFGGSVCGLRLIEKGYDVLMLEKGSFRGPKEFPRTNWQLHRWMWMPWLGFRGIFKMTFFRHVTILSGVGVGGGSLTYACTHPVPKQSFFDAASWAHLGDWKDELEPHYQTAKRMLGVVETPIVTAPDRVLKQIAEERGTPEAFGPTSVAVYFGEPNKTVPDPYFGGDGPDRTGCNHCGGCMLGCRFGAKNTLDKNYLHLARSQGLQLEADTEVTSVRPLEGGGYLVEAKQGQYPPFRNKVSFRTRNVIFAGGVLGTVKLLLDLKADRDALPGLSDHVGRRIRTNSEALIGVVTEKRDQDWSKGIAIGSILETDERSHIEPVRYPAGSGFFRLLMAPHVGGTNPFVRLLKLIGTVVRHPIKVLRAFLVPDMAKNSTILLYMRTTEGTLRFRRSLLGGLSSDREEGEAPTASIPEATELAHEVGNKMQGLPMSLVTETLLNIPTTAHILGGCSMGDSPETGAIDTEHRLFGYDGLYVVDGSAISANPGVNPTLTIVALAERAMSFVPSKGERSSAATEQP